MPKTLITQKSQYNGGISDFNRLESIPNSYAFGRSIDVRTDPQNIGVLPRTIKESGSVITDLPKWLEANTSNNIAYFYGDTGNMYSRTSGATYVNIFTVPNSHGNGLVYSAEDDYLYYSSDALIGRYGPLSGTPTNVVDFFGSQGGTPLNTNSVTFVAASSQYASRVDTASLSIVSDLAIDMQIKPATLPSVGNEMVLLSKWDESGALRSYKFDLHTAPGYFGDGSDGTLHITVDTVNSPIDSSCTGNIGTTTLNAANAGFAQGQQILIYQSQGSGVGTWMRNSIQSYVAGTIALDTPLNAEYITGAQVLVLKQYTNATIDVGVTYSAKAWDGSTGGILAFLCSGTLTVNGSLSTNATGYRGGQGAPNNNRGYQGESYNAVGGGNNTSNNGGGGGGFNNNASGGAGSYFTAGTNGSNSGGTGGTAGTTYGSTDLNAGAFFGSGGGSGDNHFGGTSSGAGGIGGGWGFYIATTLVNNGTISSNGQIGASRSSGPGDSAGGGGAGGSNFFKCQVFTNNGTVTATGGLGGPTQTGGIGGDGVNYLDYYTSFSGTATPSLNTAIDNLLITNTSFELRLSISSSGSNAEILSLPANIITDTWQQVGVSWKASTKTATFYLNATALGTRVGTLASINNNTSTFQLAMNKNISGTPVNFYNGKMDEVRLFNVTRNDADMNYGLSQQIPANTAGLVYYGQLNDDFADATSNANDLTPANTPVFTSDVPYPSPTTRLDIDQFAVKSGDTYAVPTAISESAANRLTFTPTKDPQKSIQFNIAAVGTGDWTITIHDATNVQIATVTVPNASLHTGNYEFIYNAVWHPLTNFTNEYHAHITSTVSGGTVVTETSNNLETADFVTYFGFLLNDAAWHPMSNFLNFWLVGNGRYVGKYEAPLYDPNQLVFQAGYRVRCFADWREYKAIGVMKGTNIYDFEQGRIYFWDGIAPTFNFFIDVPEGGINAMWGSRGKLYIWAGYKNQLLVYEGGDSASKLRDMPNMENNKYSEIYPGAVGMWQSILRYGVAGNGNSLAVQKGVYTYGSTNLRYPDILTYDYPISTGTLTGITTQIGVVGVVNTKLLIGWRDNVSFGVDYVDTVNPPYPTAQIQFLIEDAGNVIKVKEAQQAIALFAPLAADQSVALSYSLENSGVFTANPDTTRNTSTLTVMEIPNGRHNEVQIQMDIVSGTTAPTIKGAELITDPLGGERLWSTTD